MTTKPTTTRKAIQSSLFATTRAETHPDLSVATQLKALEGHLQDDGCYGEKLARGSELHAVVHLLPVCEEARLALIWGLKGRPFHRVE